MMPAGFHLRISSAEASGGRTTEKTRASRMRLAISCVYWPPKSRMTIELGVLLMPVSFSTARREARPESPPAPARPARLRTAPARRGSERRARPEPAAPTAFRPVRRAAPLPPGRGRQTCPKTSAGKRIRDASAADQTGLARRGARTGRAGATCRRQAKRTPRPARRTGPRDSWRPCALPTIPGETRRCRIPDPGGRESGERREPREEKPTGGEARLGGETSRPDSFYTGLALTPAA